MANYVINYSGGNVTITPGTSNSLGGLTLMGQNYANYGTNLNQNWVTILQSSAGNSPPPNPIRGQFWFNTGTNALSINTSSGSAVWQQVVTGTTSNITGNVITANYFIGNGSNIGGIAGANVMGVVANATHAVSAESANTATTATTATTAGSATTATTAGSATTAGTVTTAAQPNITSVGTLTSISTSGNTSIGGSANIAGDLTVVGNITGNIIGTISVPGSNTQVLFNNTGNAGASANLTFNSATNNLTVTGNVVITGGTISGNGSSLTNLTGSNVVGAVAIASFATSAGSATTAGSAATATTAGSATTAGTVTSAAQPAITSVGTLSSLNVSGALTTTNITTGAAGTAGTITGNWTLTASSRLEATYADLAEFYSGDSEYERGTVVEFGGQYEVTQCNSDMSTRVAGVISSDPAYVMNKKLNAKYSSCIALQGRVPCKVIGYVHKGDLLVSAGNGCARSESNPVVGTVIGKSLVDKYTTDMEFIEVAVGRF